MFEASVSACPGDPGATSEAAAAVIHYVSIVTIARVSAGSLHCCTWQKVNKRDGVCKLPFFHEAGECVIQSRAVAMRLLCDCSRPSRLNWS